MEVTRVMTRKVSASDYFCELLSIVILKERQQVFTNKFNILIREQWPQLKLNRINCSAFKDSRSRCPNSKKRTVNVKI